MKFSPFMLRSGSAGACFRQRCSAGSAGFLERSGCRAQFADGFPAIGGRLIDIADLGQSAVKIVWGKSFHHLPRIKPDAPLIGDLVIEKIAHRADFARKMQPCAEQAGPGKRASVAEFWKF